MRFNPKVSIIIPVYNGSKHMRDAIESALAQTYSNIEIIIVNDGSCDNGETEKTALSYKDKIRYFSKSNGGVSSALNLGIKNMKGNYFSWLSHDDIYYAKKIEKQINYLIDANNKKSIIYSDYEVFYENSSNIIPFHMCGVPPEKFRYWITTANGLHGCTLLIPKTAFEECGLFNETLKTTQDYDLWFRFAEKYDFVHKADILVKARNHSEQCTLKLRDTALKECDELLTHFVKALKTSELIVATNKSLRSSYAHIAVNMMSRGFHQASKVAEVLEKNSELGTSLNLYPLHEKYIHLSKLLIIMSVKYFTNLCRKAKLYFK